MGGWKLRRLGISLYPQHSSLEEMKAYVTLAHKHGFDRIFTCFMSIKDDKERQKLQQINAFAKNLGFDISADIAPNVFHELGLTFRDIGVLKEQYHLAALRLDIGFSGQEEAFMSLDDSNLKVELNLSNGTKYVDNILSYVANKANIIGCHNFYPRRYTGLSRAHFLATYAHFKSLQITTAAMISSQHGKFGAWEETEYGLPTLEEHRFLPVTVQAKDLWNTGLIDDCIIGNMYASEEELRALGEINRHKLTLKVQFTEEATPLEKQIVLQEPHFNRGDVSDYVIRSTQSRVKYKAEDFPAHDTEVLQVGDVTIENKLDIRYKGELQVVLQNMPNAGSSNTVARVVEEERFLLQHIVPWQSFQFEQ